MTDRNAKTVTDCNTSSDCWTIRIPKPRLPLVSRRMIVAVGAFALSLGFNVGFCAEAFAYSQAECEASAELHYHISGEDDGAYEDALEACTEGMTFTEWTSYVPSRCEEIAGAAYDASGDADDYAEHLSLCEAGAL